MTRQQALKNIDKPVHCWTALNGSYIGMLENLTDTRPFRAIVKTLAVTAYPVHGLSLVGYLARIPFGKNVRHEYGAVSIAPYDAEVSGPIPEWRDSAIICLRESLKSIEETIASGEKLQSTNYRKSAHLLKHSVVTMEQQLRYLEEHEDCTYFGQYQTGGGDDG